MMYQLFVGSYQGSAKLAWLDNLRCHGNDNNQMVTLEVGSVKVLYME